MPKKTFKIYLILIFLFLLTLNSASYAQSVTDSLSPKVKIIVQTLASRNEVMGEYIGIVGRKSPQWESFDSLKNLATIEELKILTNDNSPVVRCYAFWALADKRDTSVFGILLNHLTDTVRVETLFADVGGLPMVADFFLNLAARKYLFAEDYLIENKFTLDSNQTRILDSILIFNSNNLEYTKRMLLRINPPDTYYDALQTSTMVGNPYAMVALSRFKEERDINTIIRHWPTDNDILLLAIEKNPNDRYKILMEQASDSIKNHSRMFYEADYTFYLALSEFDTEFSLPLIQEHLNYPEEYDFDRKNKLNYLFLSMSKAKKPAYDSLLFSMWDVNYRLTYSAFEYLITRDSIKSISLLRKTLEDIEIIQDSCWRMYGFANTDAMVSKLFADYYKYDNEFVVNTILNKLREYLDDEYGKFDQINMLCNAISSIQDEKFIEPLFNLLRTEKYDWDLKRIIVTIMSFNRPDLNSEIMPALRENKNIIADSKEYDRDFFIDFQQFISDVENKKSIKYFPF
jgi:hypothetical protein